MSNCFLLFQMETILDTTFRFANETKKALEQAIKTSNDAVYQKGEKGEKMKKNGVGDALGRTLKHVNINVLIYIFTKYYFYTICRLCYCMSSYLSIRVFVSGLKTFIRLI